MENRSNKETVYRDALKADKDGDWSKAHEIVQDLQTTEAAWIHAYLHRKEGDEWNAGYWYKRAGKEFYAGSLKEEWSALWEYFSS